MTWLWRSMRPISVPLLRIGFRIRVVGRENVPKKGAAILASNHLSALDHAVLPCVTPRPIVNISKAQHFDKPLKAWFFRHWNVIRLQRGAGDQAALEAAKKALADGNLFCIYPEGTRSLDGKLHKGHTGVARLALEMRVPVIPVAMVGTFEAYPKGGKMKLFTPTAAIVGKPLDFSQYWGMHTDRAVCRKVTDEVMRAIQQLSGQEYVDEYQYNPEVPTHAKAKAAADAASAAAAAATGAPPAARDPGPVSPPPSSSGSPAPSSSGSPASGAAASASPGSGAPGKATGGRPASKRGGPKAAKGAGTAARKPTKRPKGG